MRDAVHALLKAGDNEQAAALARHHFYLADEVEDETRTFARLAQGRVLTLEHPAALPLLEKACAAFEAARSSVELVWPCLYLARAQRKCVRAGW